MDDVARALLGRGARAAASALLASAVARGGADAARCRQMLLQLEQRPNEPHFVPNLVVSAELAASIAGAGLFREAAIVARTLEPSVRAIELLASLDLVLAPLPSDTSRFLAVAYEQACQRGDRALALQLAQDPSASDELRRRAMMIAELRRAASPTQALDAAAPSDRGASSGFSAGVGDCVRSLFEHRDWARGEAELRSLGGEAGAAELLTVVVRLREMMARLFEDEAGAGPSTVPLQGPSVAVFHLRMGNLSEAERVLRRVVRDEPGDTRAATLFADIEHLRSAANRSSAPPVAPEWLDKRGHKPSAEGWGVKRAAAAWSEEDDDPVTSVMRPDEEAELHLRAGRADKAIQIFEELAKRYPDRPHFAQRAEEIRDNQVRRELVFVEELTIRQTPLNAPAEEPTRQAVVVKTFAKPPSAPPPPAVPAPEEDDDEMTFGATEVTSQRFELGAPAVAENGGLAERVQVRTIVRIS